jgi:hypothetical protein
MSRFEEVKDQIPNPRVKCRIAILDTGIDMNHILIANKRSRIQFLQGGKEDNHDYDGHGTLVAHTILRLAPYAQILVAKVHDTPHLELEESQIELLAAVWLAHHGEKDPQLILTKNISKSPMLLKKQTS